MHNSQSEESEIHMHNSQYEEKAVLLSNSCIQLFFQRAASHELHCTIDIPPKGLCLFLSFLSVQFFLINKKRFGLPAQVSQNSIQPNILVNACT